MSFYKWRQRLSPQTEQANVHQDTQFIDLSALAHHGNTRWHIVLSLGNGVELTLSQQ
ncbi:IS66 family insertion sequence element accessory protein TnpA [Shewanella algae]